MEKLIEKIREEFASIDLNNFSCMKLNSIDIRFKNGISKVCFCQDNNFVIKVPFKGRLSDISFKPFIGAGSTVEEGWDYCKKEEYIYNQAVEAGIECFFAKTSYGGKFTGLDGSEVPFYIQEKVPTIGYIEKFSYRDLDLSSAESLVDSSDYHSLNIRWIVAAIESHGEKLVSKLLDFLRDFDINDFHLDNIGFREDNTPVLFDFSGWNR